MRRIPGYLSQLLIFKLPCETIVRMTADGVWIYLEAPRLCVPFPLDSPPLNKSRLLPNLGGKGQDKQAFTVKENITKYIMAINNHC